MKLVAYHVWAPSYEILMHGGVCVCVCVCESGHTVHTDPLMAKAKISMTRNLKTKKYV